MKVPWLPQLNPKPQLLNLSLRNQRQVRTGPDTEVGRGDKQDWDGACWGAGVKGQRDEVIKDIFAVG